MMTVHSVVLLAYKGRRPHKMVTRHLDGNPDNNHVSNRAYGTYADNSRDAILHGTSYRKLQADDVRKIRKMAAEGIKPKEIHQHFPFVTIPCIYAVISGRTHNLS